MYIYEMVNNNNIWRDQPVSAPASMPSLHAASLPHHGGLYPSLEAFIMSLQELGMNQRR